MLFPATQATRNASRIQLRHATATATGQPTARNRPSNPTKGRVTSHKQQASKARWPKEAQVKNSPRARWPWTANRRLVSARPIEEGAPLQNMTALQPAGIACRPKIAPGNPANRNPGHCPPGPDACQGPLQKKNKESMATQLRTQKQACATRTSKARADSGRDTCPKQSRILGTEVAVENNSPQGRTPKEDGQTKSKGRPD